MPDAPPYIHSKRTARPRDIIVVGAGVAGMASALTLLDHGHHVTVVDAAPHAGLGTSFANGAQLSYSYTDALASPATLGQLPRMLCAMDSGFRLKPSLDPDFLRWGLAFLRNSSLHKFRANTVQGLLLAFESRAALHRLTLRHDLDFLHTTPGKLHLYRSRKSLAAAETMLALKNRHGARQRWVSRDELAQIEPALADMAQEFAGAIHTRDEEVGDPYRFCSAAAAVVRASKRGNMLLDTRIAQLSAGPGGPAVICASGQRIGGDAIILCTAMGSVSLARQLGVQLPIMPMKGYSITAPPGTQAPRVSITDVGNRLVFARLGDQMRIAGLADLGHYSTAIAPRRLAALVSSARTALPNAADYDHIDASWCGLRPMTPNSLPIIEMIAPGIIANTGHGGLGWTFAAGCADRVAAMLDD